MSRRKPHTMNQFSNNPENPQWQGNAPSPYGYGEQYVEPAPAQPTSSGSVPPPSAYSMPVSYPPANQYPAYPGMPPANQYPAYPGMPPGFMAPPEKGQGMAVAGLVLGIISMIAWLLPFIG